MLYRRAFAALVPLIATVLAASPQEDDQQPQVVMDASSDVTYSSMSENTFCLSTADAEVLGKSFGLLISNYTTELANQLLADEFTDQADSINTLINNSPMPNQPVR